MDLGGHSESGRSTYAGLVAIVRLLVSFIDNMYSSLARRCRVLRLVGFEVLLYAFWRSIHLLERSRTRDFNFFFFFVFISSKLKIALLLLGLVSDGHRPKFRRTRLASV